MLYSRKFWVFTARKRIILGSILLVFTAIIIYIAFLLYHNAVQDRASEALKAMGEASGGDTIGVLRAKQVIEQGELVDAGMVEMVMVPLELAPEEAVSSLNELKGMRLKHKIAGKELLNKLDLIPEAAIFEEGDRLIEHDFQAGAVPAAVTLGSAIDIKLFIKGGEDAVVVSKAVVISRNANLLAFYMNEKEQEYIKEAAAEGMLFAAQYLDDSQVPSEVTYTSAFFKEDHKNAR